MTLLWLAVAAACVACTASPAGAVPARALIYSNVHYIEEAGDDVGMEVRLHPAAKPWVDFILCEGECGRQVRLPITITRNGFTFVYREALVDQDGRPAPDAVMRFVATYEGRNLMIRQKGVPTEKLMPQRKPVTLR